MNNRYIAIAIAALATSGCVWAQSADELLSQGREAFMNYEFDKASRLYAQAKKKVRKSDEYYADKHETFNRQLMDARNFLERVEQIAVIDSLTVPRSDFFKSYRLPQSAGSLGDKSALPPKADGADVNYVFTNEGEDYKIWAQPDTTGYMHLVESIRMTDGNWGTPTPTGENLSEESDAIFPFMMADGVTLYYATNNEDESIGGYDIMVATRDAADGSFLQPSNLGFPYNSPFDDYLLAIDELNGVGWWATDRNQLDDELTIYVFVTNDLRKNYPVDEEDIIGFARIDDYIATQPEDADYDELLATIRAIDPTVQKRKSEFDFPAPGGKIFHNYEDLPNMASRAAMRKYVAAEADLADAKKALSAMRRKYADSRSQTLGEKIGQAEKLIDAKREDVKRLRNEVYKSLAR